MRDKLTRLVHASQIYVVVGLAVVPMIVAALDQSVGRSPQQVAVYASVGEELMTFSVDAEHGALTRQSSLKLPGFVQEAWASPSTPYLYVAWSNGGTSYAGSGVSPIGDRHGVTAFRVDDAGALHEAGPPGALRSRPIHITGDLSGRHLLVAYNDPSGISVHTINRDGTVGPEVPQAGDLDAGIYAHQVRVLPGNRGVLLVTTDYGNCEVMRDPDDPDTGEPHTAHTTNPMPVLLAGVEGVELAAERPADNRSKAEEDEASGPKATRFALAVDAAR